MSPDAGIQRQGQGLIHPGSHRTSARACCNNLSFSMPTSPTISKSSSNPEWPGSSELGADSPGYPGEVPSPRVLTFPKAKSTESKYRSIPKRMKKRPKPVMPTPISAKGKESLSLPTAQVRCPVWAPRGRLSRGRKMGRFC